MEIREGVFKSSNKPYNSIFLLLNLNRLQNIIKIKIWQLTIQIRIIIIIAITNKEYKAEQKSICVRMRKGENGEGT